MRYKIFTGSTIVDEDTQFQLHQSQFSPDIFDQNFILLKNIPTLSDFFTLEKNFSAHWINHFLMFKFSFDLIPNHAFFEAVTASGYTIDKMLLYAMTHEQFKVKEKITVKIEQLTANNIRAYHQLKYTQDIVFGETFANINRDFLARLLEKNKLEIFLVKENTACVGFIGVIKQTAAVEIYDLYVSSAFRHRKIATALIQHVANHYINSKILVVADAADTVKEMYEKLGFQQKSFWYQIQKEI